MAPCLLVLMFATLPLFCEQAFSLGGVGKTDWFYLSCTNKSLMYRIFILIKDNLTDKETKILIKLNKNWIKQRNIHST